MTTPPSKVLRRSLEPKQYTSFAFTARLIEAGIDASIGTAGYVDWSNNTRLHTAIGGIPPAEHEAAYYVQNQPPAEAGPNT